MRIPHRLWFVVSIPFLLVLASSCLSVDEPTLDPTTVSVHTVLYGTMPFHTKGRGQIARIGPNSKARVQVLLSFAQHLKLGYAASVKIVGIGGALPARVTGIGEIGSDGSVPIELSFEQPLPHEVSPGDSADALIDYGKIENTLYMQRGAFDQENSEAPVFRVDPDHIATRVKVRFGTIASELIEIKSGLKEGDKVIVTDMSRWTQYERIRIQ